MRVQQNLEGRKEILELNSLVSNMFVFSLTDFNVSEEVRVDCKAKSSENLLHIFISCIYLYI